MLTFEVDGLRCQRVLVDDADVGTTGAWAEADYSFVVAHGAFADPAYEVEHKTSAIIDLTDGLDAAFGRFSATSRNEVRGSHKIPELEVHHGFDELPFDEVYAFHVACEADRGWIPVAPGELAASEVFTVTFAGEPIAAMSAYGHGERLRIARIFSSKRSRLSDVLTNRVYGCAQKRLVHDICAHGVQVGARSLDLGGVDPDDPAKAGIARFKASFGPALEPVVVARRRSEAFLLHLPVLAERGWDVA